MNITLPSTQDIDTGALATELSRAVSGEVRFDDGSRALYATDSSNYRQVPIGVVLPRTEDDVEATISLCRRYGAPILSRGGGTSLSGQTCNVAVLLDYSKYLNRIVEVDPNRRIARVQPGVVLDDLRAEAEKYHLTFGPDPATHDRCTLGGMIGNNSCGVHSVMSGKTDANVESLDVATYRGLRMVVGRTDKHELDRIVSDGGERGGIYKRLLELRDRNEEEIRRRFPDIPRCVSGYALTHLLPESGFNVAGALVGTEGTCVTVVEATLRLVSSPPHRTLLVLGYRDVFEAADAVPEILDHNPIGLEGMDDRMISDMRQRHLHLDEVALLPEGKGWLLVEFGTDDPAESIAAANKCLETLQRGKHGPTSMLCDRPEVAKRLWSVRESALGATAIVPGKFERWPGWDDSAVAPNLMGKYLRDLQKLMDVYEYDGAFYGHFGDGCLHVRYNFDLTSAPGIEKFRGFVGEAADLVLSYGGSLSGEHGDGQSHGHLLPKMFGPQLMEAFHEFKSIWDPDWKMNPGKVIDANPIVSNLRLGADYDPPSPRTHFSFVEDGGSFAKASLRCVGVGKCRREGSGTMCPSYMVTKEEEHSTRGRARLLFEMLEGDAIRGGWRDEHVREALDLCLACKGCKSECPVNVDMATYKAEFLSHFYRGRLRPRTAYSMGLIYWWARFASRVPRLVNRVGTTPGLSRLLKWTGGISPQRRLPAFAISTFKNRFHARKPKAPDRSKRVILWPDTFNNHFHPQTAEAAVEVLEALGFAVSVPRQSLCCGRPLYDYGMLDLAKHLLRKTLRTLQSDIRAGIPVVVLEPSCAAVFKDEMLNLFPNDEDANRLASQTFLLSQFVERYRPEFKWPPLPVKATVHGHCHHKSIFGMGDEESLLEKCGVDYDLLDSGCCGMAGAFGFEKDHYDISVGCGERVLLPAVREAPQDEIVVANGFSCREQISQLTGREPIHLAEVLRMSLGSARVGSDSSAAS